MRSDLGAELIEAALEGGLITSEECRRVEALVKESGGKLYAAQILVRERIINCSELLTLQNNVAAKIYECPRCQTRYARKSLPQKTGETFTCKGCDKKFLKNPSKYAPNLEVQGFAVNPADMKPATNGEHRDEHDHGSQGHGDHDHGHGG